jgi:hypothetical protein
MLGFSSGRVRFYTTHDGTLILCRMLHDSPVLKFNILSNAAFHRAAVRPIGAQPEAISVLYHQVLVLIEAESLAVAIRGFYSQLADNAVGATPLEALATLVYRKWKLTGQSSIAAQSYRK